MAIAVIVALMGVPVAFAVGVVNFVGAHIPYLGAFIGGPSRCYSRSSKAVEVWLPWSSWSS